MNKVLKFKVYPETRHGFYFEVHVYPTQKRMVAACNKYGNPENVGYFDPAGAATLCHRVGYENRRLKRNIWSHKLGIIVFWRGEVNAETIAHETAHAILEWAFWKKIKAGRAMMPPIRQGAPKLAERADNDEERFCYAVGDVVNQIARFAHANNLF
jgi:hypothetical protein